MNSFHFIDFYGVWCIPSPYLLNILTFSPSSASLIILLNLKNSSQCPVKRKFNDHKNVLVSFCHGMFFFLHQLKHTVLLGLWVWVCSCGLSELHKYHSTPFWLSMFLLRNQLLFWWAWNHMWVGVSRSFQYASTVLYTLCFNYMMCEVSFLLLFGILYASYILMDLYLYLGNRLWLLLKIFSMRLVRSSPSWAIINNLVFFHGVLEMVHVSFIGLLIVLDWLCQQF